MYIKIRNKFLRLLKENGCYSCFINNFKRLDRYTNYPGSKTFNGFIKASIRSRKLEKSSLFYYFYFLNDAFEWGKTKEGFDYWCNIAHKFMNEKYGKENI